MNKPHSKGTEEQVPPVLTRAWKRHDPLALEYFNLQAARGMLLLSGQITSVENGVPCFVHYAAVCDEKWITRESHVHVNVGGTHSLITLVRFEGDRWKIDGEEREDLGGAVDLDIQWTPATNALPINRLNLEVGESREVDAASVRLPELSVERLSQKYTRVGENQYRYESGGGTFVADLSVDDAGFVERYGNVWVCIGKT